MKIELGQVTAHQARFLAESLQAKAGGLDALSAALFDAKVDLNPHQIEAALVGVGATAERGRLLADEVGLGKTIEAALVLCQRWAEGKRRLLVVGPAALRRQWAAELDGKFGLPTKLLDGKDGADNPFEVKAVAICSYQYAAARADKLQRVGWDLVIIDEAHRLRNAYKAEKSRMGRPLLNALKEAPKLLLTATPLQNSMMELYGVVSIIDQRAFGDAAAFKAKFEKRPDFTELRARLAGTCQRTLRKDVLAFVKYTKRSAITHTFRSSAIERQLYDAVTDLLARDDLRCFPVKQRALLRMLLRKLLASSSRAIGSALSTLHARMTAFAAIDPQQVALLAAAPLLDAVLDPDEPAPLPVEGDEDEDDEGGGGQEEGDGAADERPKLSVQEELSLLRELIAQAAAVGVDARATALLTALQKGFASLRKMKAAEKAVVFTESRRTQDWLAGFLNDNGYAGRVVCFNGSNSHPDARAALNAWEARNPVAAKQASRAVNMRAALVDQFEREGAVLLTTEAGAEGLNLQFCSMVVNYDLPWNPQRVEQRIGRCHRYGQKHDVVVVNFADTANEAEQRVLELLSHKTDLFDGVFGASDKVLGTVAGGVGLERKIHRIFQTCRKPEQIAEEFQRLREELDEAVKVKEAKARDVLFSHFDAEVHDKLRFGLDETTTHLDRLRRQLWALARWALADRADFVEKTHQLTLRRSPVAEPLEGEYRFVVRGEDQTNVQLLRFSHPLGEHIMKTALDVSPGPAALRFSLTAAGLKVSALEPLVGRRGALAVGRLALGGLIDEMHVVLGAVTEDGAVVEPEVMARMLELPGVIDGPMPGWAPVAAAAAAMAAARAEREGEAAKRGSAEHQAASDRVSRWAADQITSAEVAITELRVAIEGKEREVRAAADLSQKRALEAELLALEGRRRQARHRVMNIEDEIAVERRKLLAELDARLATMAHFTPLYTIAWTLE